MNDDFRTIRIRLHVIGMMDRLVEVVSSGFSLGARTTRSDVIEKALEAYARELGYELTIPSPSTPEPTSQPEQKTQKKVKKS